jgi:hypothetical protein
MPNFGARMWMGDGQGGLAAVFYGPSRVTARAGGSSEEVTVIEETDYPFSERVAFHVRARRPVRFPLILRIPGWCRKASLAINGRALKVRCGPGTFVRLERTFAPNDCVELSLPMEVRLSRWPQGGVGVERGPLVFALGIKERWTPYQIKGRTCRDLPAWDAHPASRWNYALALDKTRAAESVKVIRRDMAANPWTPAEAPILLEVPARRVAGWTLDKKKAIQMETFEGAKLVSKTVKGDFVLTPPLPDARTLRRRLGRRVETITLVPYGCTRLRIAVFPSAQTL